MPAWQRSWWEGGSTSAPLPSQRCQCQLGVGWVTAAANMLIQGNEGRGHAKINAWKDATLWPCLLWAAGGAGERKFEMDCTGISAALPSLLAGLRCLKVTNLLFLVILEYKTGSLFQLSLPFFYHTFLSPALLHLSEEYRDKFKGLPQPPLSTWMPPWKLMKRLKSPCKNRAVQELRGTSIHFLCSMNNPSPRMQLKSNLCAQVKQMNQQTAFEFLNASATSRISHDMLTKPLWCGRQNSTTWRIS